MHIDHIRSFLEAASFGSFLDAAKHLNVSQSTLSARIKALEMRVGTKLFIRKKTGVELNNAGRAFHRHALIMVRAWDHAQKAAVRRNEPGHVISIGIQESLWGLLVTNWLEELKRRAPEVQVRLVSDVTRSLVDQICGGLLELAVTWEPRRRRDLHIEHLADIPLIMVASIPCEWIGALPTQYIFVDWGEPFRAQHDLAFGYEHLPNITAGFSSNGLDLIMQGGGAGYFMEPVVTHLIEQRQLFPVVGAPTFTRSVYVVYPDCPLDKNLLESALDALRSCVSIVSLQI